MRTSSLIGHVVQVLDQIRSSRRPADVILAEFFRGRRYLGSRDRRYISETVFGILRHYALAEAYAAAAERVSEPGGAAERVASLKLVAAYARKILHQDTSTLLPDLSSLWTMHLAGTAPDRFLAALDTMDLPPASATPAERIALVHSLPRSIAEEWVERYGESEADLLSAASNRPAPTTIRVNTLRCTVEQCQAALKSEGIGSERTPLSPVGLILEKRVNVNALHTFMNGWFEMQDEGSQLLSMVLDARPGSFVVDACAGGGGKTLHMAAMMRNQGTLLALDVERRRLQGLEERLPRAGAAIVRTAEASAGLTEQWKGRADAVLIDAPCSGVGTFRRNPGAKLTFTEQFVSTVCRTQEGVLESYAKVVKPGGRLVYATCSLLVRENEGVVEKFLRDHPEFHTISALDILARQGITVPSSGPYLTLLPHRTSTDGFFAAAMERVV